MEGKRKGTMGTDDVTGKRNVLTQTYIYICSPKNSKNVSTTTLVCRIKKNLRQPTVFGRKNLNFLGNHPEPSAPSFKTSSQTLTKFLKGPRKE